MDIFEIEKLSESIYSFFKDGKFGTRFVFYTPESLATSNNAIASVVETRFRDIEQRIEQSRKGSSERRELENQRDELQESKNLVDAPVTNEREVKDAIERIGLVNKQLEKISKDGVSAQNVMMMNTYRAFLDDATVEKIDKMFSRLQTSFQVGDVLERGGNVIHTEDKFKAKQMCDKRDKETKLEKIRAEVLRNAEHNAFEVEDPKLDADLKAGKISKKKYSKEHSKILKGLDKVKKSIADDTFMTGEELDSALKDVDGMTEKEKKIYIDSKAFEIKFNDIMSRYSEKAKGSLLGNEISKIQSTLIEVRNYRGLALHEYIQGRLANIRKIYEERGWPVEDLDLLDKGLRDKSNYLQDPDSIKALLKQIKHLELRSGAITKTEKLMLTPEIKDKLGYVEQEFSHFDINSKKATAIAHLIPKTEGESVVYSAKMQGVQNLANHRQFLADLKSSINSINQQERIHATSALDSVYKILRRAEADKATRIIKGLAIATTMDKMLKIVKVSAGEHIEIIKSSNEFKEKYGSYTEGGMVFYRRGDEWKVIIDGERMSAPGADPVKFKEQMIHEMHHVEFDYDEDISTTEVIKFTSNKMWPEVKSAFVNKAKLKMPPDYKGPAKTEFTEDDWKDADVVSELYAMEDTIKNHVATQVGKKTPFDDLVLAVTTAGLLPAVKIAGFEGSDEGVVRGAEMGDEPGIEPDTEQDKDYQKIGDVASSSDETTDDFKAKTLIDRIEAMRKTGYVDQVPYAAEILKIIEDVCKGNPSSEYLEDADETVSEVEGEVKQYSQKHPKGSGNPLQNVWNNTTFVSLNDFVQLGKNIYEFYSRRTKRRADDHAARLGTAFFTNIPFLKELAMDSSANQEKAEAEYVNEWKGRLESKDACVLLDMIDKMGEQIMPPDKDQLKAILRILADKGRIDWRRPGLWKVLNKLQSTEKFMPNDQFLMQNPDALNQRLMSAMGVMWDYDEFQSLLNKNEGSYDSKKEEYIKTYDKMSGQLDARLNDILQQYRNGSEADPTEYEGILEYAILKGKSHQESVFFYLISGMACGLLSADRGIHLDKHLNLFPPLDWFTEMTPPPTQQWFENLSNTYFKEEYRTGKKREDGTSDFQTFYWTVVLNNEDVIQRVEKTAAPDAWDHDWSRGIAAVGGPDTVNRFLAGRSSQKALRPTAAANQTAGLLQWFDENARKPGSHWDNNVGNQIAGIAMFDGIMENVAYSDNITYTRKEAIVGGKPVREGKVGHHGNKNAEWHWRKLQQILDIIDPVLFGMLRNKQMRDEGSDNDMDGKRGVAHAERIKSYLSTTYGGSSNFDNAINDITAMNDIFAGFAVIINEVVKQRSDRLEAVRDLLVDRRTGRVRNVA